MCRLKTLLVAFLVSEMFLVSCLYGQDAEQLSEDWVWYDGEGNQRTRAELDSILAIHER